MEAGGDWQAGREALSQGRQEEGTDQCHHHHSSPGRLLPLRDWRYLGSDDPAAGEGRLAVAGLSEGARGKK